MELIPHDLVKISNIDEISLDSPKLEWVYETLLRAPNVVVRRAPIIENKIPIGIRGSNRSQRLAATIEYSNIILRITPEELVENKCWRTCTHIQNIGISHTLDSVDLIFAQYGLKWGPTGSIGFELASGVPATTESSDLDIIVRTPQFISHQILGQLMDKLLQIPIPIDVQLETPKGSVALAEYVRNQSSMIVRTINGPCLVKDPWI